MVDGLLIVKLAFLHFCSFSSSDLRCLILRRSDRDEEDQTNEDAKVNLIFGIGSAEADKLNF
jgi:hypothetical protein